MLTNRTTGIIDYDYTTSDPATIRRLLFVASVGLEISGDFILDAMNTPAEVSGKVAGIHKHKNPTGGTEVYLTLTDGAVIYMHTA